MTAVENARELGESLWRRLWAAGVTDSLTVIEQISFLILLRTLDLRTVDSLRDSATKAFAAYPKLHWERLKERPGDHLLELLQKELIPFLSVAVNSPAFDAAMVNASVDLPRADMVRDCIAAIDRIDDLEGRETAAELYDALLDQLLLSAGNAQLRTPRPLVEAMVELADPTADQVICDPAAGTGAFLIEANRRLQGECNGLLGYDLNPSMVRLGFINMLIHGVSDPEMSYMDTLSRAFQWPAVDVVVSHPPFGGDLDRRDLSPDLRLESARTEKSARPDVLFLELSRNLLRPRGRAVILVPEGVLFARSQTQIEVRRRWLRQGRVEAVISLPPRALGRQANVKTAILLLAASGRTEQVWFGELEGDPAEQLRDLPSAVRWRIGRESSPPPAALALGQQMWCASIDEIVKEGWSLSPSSHRRFDGSAAETDDPHTLLDEVEGLEGRIREEIASARENLGQRS
ncbi:MAG TPA: N-6 DNA methylase [Solirubrobacterales bacterium]|nr:N-6 DNA methylase [Solirubrobacterales bacterium]